jgi:asparagine synthetase B (glutamine-hydrolysing)
MQMCGIWALLGKALPPEILKACLQELYARGPDATRSMTLPVGEAETSAQLGFTRLAINGLSEAGMQPFQWPATSDTKSAFLICNGE